jgi:hypothetical protein
MSKTASSQTSLTNDPKDNNPFNKKMQIALPESAGEDRRESAEGEKNNIPGYNPALGKMVADVLKELGDTRDKAQGQVNFGIVPNINRAYAEMQRSLSKIEKGLGASSSRWEGQKATRIFSTSYATAKIVAKFFTAGEPFDFDKLNEKLRRPKSPTIYDEIERVGGMIGNLDYLVKKGFLETRSVYTGKGSKQQYRIKEDGLEILRKQEAAAEKSRSNPTR